MASLVTELPVAAAIIVVVILFQRSQAKGEEQCLCMLGQFDDSLRKHGEKGIAILGEINTKVWK